MKNQLKIKKKSDRQQDGCWNGFWRPLGPIFIEFEHQVGDQVAPKMAPKSKKKKYQDDVQKTSKIERPGRAK